MSKLKPISKEIVDAYFMDESQDLSKLIAAQVYKIKVNEGLDIPVDPLVYYVNADVHNMKVRKETPVGQAPNELNIRFTVADPKKVRGLLAHLENKQMDEEEDVLNEVPVNAPQEESLDELIGEMPLSKKLFMLDQLELQASQEIELFGKFADEYVNKLLTLPDDEYMLKVHRTALKEAGVSGDGFITDHIQAVFEEKTGSSIILNDYTVDPIEFKDKRASFWDLEGAGYQAPTEATNKQALVTATGVISIPIMLAASSILGKLKRQGERAGRSIARTEAFRSKVEA